MGTRQTKISELIPDQQNANRGTERGAAMLEESLRRYGAGRSILVDKHGRVIAGNKTLEQAGQIGIDDVLLVPTDGRQIVAVQRTDLDLEADPAARELAYADNRVSEVDLDFDPEQIARDLDAGADLSALWKTEELEAITKSFDAESIDAPRLASGDRAPFRQMTFTIHDEQYEEIERALRKAKDDGGDTSLLNENSNGNALAWICGVFNRGEC